MNLKYPSYNLSDLYFEITHFFVKNFELQAYVQKSYDSFKIKKLFFSKFLKI